MGRTFSELLSAARRRDPPALDELYRRYTEAVTASTRKHLPRELRVIHDSADVTQSVFADVLRALPRFEDRGEAAFRRWLFLKVQNKVRDKLRRRLGRDGRRRTIALGHPEWLPDDEGTPSQEVSLREAMSRIRELSETLDEVDLEIVQLRVEEGLRFAAVAERCGLNSPDAARKRFARCLADLRRKWLDETDERKDG